MGIKNVYFFPAIVRVIKNSPHEILLKKKCFFYPNFFCPQKVTDPAVKALPLTFRPSDGKGGGSPMENNFSQNPDVCPKNARELLFCFSFKFLIFFPKMMPYVHILLSDLKT